MILWPSQEQKLICAEGACYFHIRKPSVFVLTMTGIPRSSSHLLRNPFKASLAADLLEIACLALWEETYSSILLNCHVTSVKHSFHPA